MLVPMSRDFHIIYRDYETRRNERMRFLLEHTGKTRNALVKDLVDNAYFDLKKNGKEILFC